MAEAGAPIPGTQAAPSFGKRRVLSPPLCAFSCPHLHPCPLLHGFLAFDLAFLFHPCRSTETQVNPSSALKRTKHHQSDPSIVPGILGSSWLQRAHVHTSKSSKTYTNRIPFSDRIRFPTGFPNLPVSSLLAGLLNLC